MFLTGAKYDDIYVSQVSNGCVQVCFMVKNHLIPKLRKCYMPENINKTHQSLSTDFKNKIIEVVIQDEVMDLSSKSFFLPKSNLLHYSTELLKILYTIIYFCFPIFLFSKMKLVQTYVVLETF